MGRKPVTFSVDVPSGLNAFFGRLIVTTSLVSTGLSSQDASRFTGSTQIAILMCFIRLSFNKFVCECTEPAYDVKIEGNGHVRHGGDLLRKKGIWIVLAIPCCPDTDPECPSKPVVQAGDK